MTEQIQCDNCGAVLLEEDVFCGECGAPRPSLAEATPPEAQEPTVPQSPPAPQPPPTPRPAAPSTSPTTGWRVSVIILAIVAAILCLVGLAAFLLFGLTETEGFTTQENWLFATFCCLLPIAGTGGVVAVAAVGVWLARVRNR
jgi:hypothetical protein